MSAHALAHPREIRLDINRFGLWLFFLSESMIFLILLFARFYMGVERPDELNQPLGLAITTVLLLSSLTAYRAETAIVHGERARMLRNLLGTILLGTLFLIGVVGFEWREAPHMGISLQEGYGIAFFSMTGMHALHVLSGVLLLLVVYARGRRGSFSPGSHWGMEAVVKYWHFVDVVWVFFYPALYLVGP